MNTNLNSANVDALQRILAVVPRWTGVQSAREALGLQDHVLLHAGPPLPDARQLPAPMRHAAILSCLAEGRATDRASAEALIDAGRVRFEPTAAHRASTPLVAMISASTTLALIESGEGANKVRWHGFLGTGGGAQMRFGSCDPVIVERLKFREQTLAPGFAALLSAGPVDLLSIARSALTEGDDLHNRLSSATQVLHGVLSTRKTDAADTQAALQTLIEAPLYFLNVWMPACALMLDAARGVAGSSVVTRLCANGQVTGIQLAGLPNRWFTAPAGLVQGPYMKGLTIPDPQFPPATGDSGIIDAFGLGGQVLRRAPSLLTAFEPWLAKDDAQRAQSLLCAMHPVLGVAVGVDAAAVIRTGRTPVLSTGMVDPFGRGLLGRGLGEMPMAPFREAMAALG
jgi:hypothetical protein